MPVARFQINGVFRQFCSLNKSLTHSNADRAKSSILELGTHVSGFYFSFIIKNATLVYVTQNSVFIIYYVWYIFKHVDLHYQCVWL